MIEGKVTGQHEVNSKKKRSRLKQSYSDDDDDDDYGEAKEREMDNVNEMCAMAAAAAAAGVGVLVCWRCAAALQHRLLLTAALCQPSAAVAVISSFTNFILVRI